MHPFVSGLILLVIGLFLIVGGLWVIVDRGPTNFLALTCLVVGVLVICFAITALFFSAFYV
jgi:hypothetical protein